MHGDMQCSSPFEPVDEILCCARDHSNETSCAVLLHGTICCSIFKKMKFWIFIEFWSGTLGSERVLGLKCDTLGCKLVTL